MNAKSLLLYLIFLSELGLSLNAQNSFYYSTRTLHVNNIILNANNIGSLDQNGAAYFDLITGDNKQIVYDHSLWIISKINDVIHAGFSQWFSTYSAGPVIDGMPAMLIHPEDSLKYRVYKITKGDDEANQDYAEWPFEMGAPVDQFGKPDILGDQMLWSVYNAMDSSAYYSYRNPRFGSRLPFPVEIQHSAYARNGNGVDDFFTGIVFLEWTIINKGTYNIDFDYINENRPAVDTNNYLGYCWGYSGEDQNKAVGYSVLFGPVIESVGDTAIFKGKQFPDHKNLGLSSFHAIVDDGPPYDPPDNPSMNLKQAWNIARGCDTEGNQIIDPISGAVTKFTYSGNPTTNEGWIFETETGGGAGFNIFCGPFSMEPQDTQWIMAALIPVVGTNHIESINKLKSISAKLRTISYDTLVYGNAPLIVSAENKLNLPDAVKLFQNYPNPFNNSTRIKYSVPYTHNSVNVRLEVFDVLCRRIITLVDRHQSSGIYEIDYDASGLNSGVYFYKLTVGRFSSVKKFVLLK